MGHNPLLNLRRGFRSVSVILFKHPLAAEISIPVRGRILGNRKSFLRQRLQGIDPLGNFDPLISGNREECLRGLTGWPVDL